MLHALLKQHHRLKNDRKEEKGMHRTMLKHVIETFVSEHKDKGTTRESMLVSFRCPVSDRGLDAEQRRDMRMRSAADIQEQALNAFLHTASRVQEMEDLTLFVPSDFHTIADDGGVPADRFVEFCVDGEIGIQNLYIETHVLNAVSNLLFMDNDCKSDTLARPQDHYFVMVTWDGYHIADCAVSCKNLLDYTQHILTGTAGISQQDSIN